LPEITPFESGDRGVPVWVPIGVVLVVVALLSVPALFLIRSALEAEWTLFDSDEVVPGEGVSDESVPAEVHDVSGAGMAMAFPSDWVVFPLYDDEVRAESFERAAEDFGPEAETFLRNQVEWIQSVSGTRTLVAWDIDGRAWLSVGRWPRSVNDYPAYVLNDLTQTADGFGGMVDHFYQEFSTGDVPGAHGILTAPWSDAPGDLEQHWYVMWPEQGSYRLIFTFDKESERDRRLIGEMMESLDFG